MKTWILLIFQSCAGVVQAQSYQIVFAQKVSRDADICVINADGSGFAKILDVPAADSGPDLGNSGSSMVFHSERKGWWKIWYVDIRNNLEVKQLTFPRSSADYDPVLSPSGQQVIFTSGRTGNEDLFMLGLDGSGLTQLTDKPSSQRYARWINDGEILFYSDESGTYQVYRMNLETRDSQMIRLGAGNNTMADVAPDGSRLVFTSDRTGNDELYTGNIHGGEVKLIATSPLLDYRAKWSPDGRWIVFERSNRKDHSQIWVMKPDGTELSQVTKIGYNYGPTWLNLSD